MSLQIITPPTAEPVTVQDVKDELRLTVTVDDALIQRLITPAREYAEKRTRRSLAVATYAAFFDRFPCPSEPLRIPAPPLLAVTGVKYLDNSLTPQTWDPIEYYVANMQSPGLIVPKPGCVYPSPVLVPGAVEVDFKAGYGDPSGPALPKLIKEGICRMTMYLYSHPEVITSEGLKESPVSFAAFFPKVWVF